MPFEANPALLNIIGSGVKFNFRFNSAGKVDHTPADIYGTKISENLRYLLSTSPGERVNNPEYGSDLPSLLFEPNDEILQDLAFVAITESIARFEPRIRVTGVGFPEITPNTFRVIVVYVLRGSTDQLRADLLFSRSI